jgi:hypothetical protein
MVRKPSLNLQNLFWRKMKRITSQKKKESTKTNK